MKKEASSAISEVYGSMRDLTWLIRQIPFIFFNQFSFSWGKWNIHFSWYFLQPFSQVISEFFNPELVKEFSDTFDSSGTFDSTD